MLRRYAFKDKELCPCKSGLIYKDCCKVKKARAFHTQGEAMNLMGKVMKKSRVKICLYNGCTAKPKDIIGAHALQENRILNKLEVDKHVIMQDFTKAPELIEIEEGKPEPFYILDYMHIKDATVATCFCKTHDNAVFAKIEKDEYPLTNLDKEQIFLFAYKTFSFEFYTEIVASKYHTHMFKEVPQLTKDKLNIIQYRNNVLKLEDLQYYKDYFDKALMDKDYSGLETIVVEIAYRIQFANYMMFAPPYDIKGKKVKPIERKSKKMRYIFFTAIPEENKSYLLISALKQDMNVYGKYFERIRNAPLGLLQYYVNVFVPLYSQNLILSPTLWDSWTEKGQFGVQYATSEYVNAALIKGVQFGLHNIAKKRLQNDVEIDSSRVPFNFFIPYSGI